ncbi:MAG: tetratricopeptide repeat protein, partial [Pirellulales bacterium]
MADTEKELSDAVVQASRIITRGEQLLPITAELQNAAQRTVQQSCLLAELLEQSGDSTSADEVLAPLAEKQEPAAIGQQIRLATVRRNWNAAVDATKRLIELPDGRKSANVRQLVDFLEHDFQFAEALSWVEQWKKLSPGSISPWLTQSRILLLDGQHEEAIETMRRASIEFAGNQDIRSRLAQLYIETGKLADAERIYWQQYEETESLDGKIRAVAQLAQVAETQGRVDQLVERFDERRRNNRLSIEPLLAMAEIHRVADNYEKRRQALTEASKLKPDDLGLLLQVARIEEQEGDWERAVRTLQRAAALDKTNKTQQRIARLHLQYGNTAEGFAMLYELAGGDESDPRDVEDIADAIIGVGEWQEAREYLTAQLEHHDDDYRLRYLLAITNEEEFETQAAIDEFVKLLSVENEIPGLNQVNPLSGINNYLDLLRDVLPPDSLDLIVQSQQQHMAYSYRQRQGTVIALGASGQSSRVAMPMDIETVHRYATAHLLSLAQELNEKEVETLQSRMEANGVPNADLLMALGPNQQRDPQSLTTALEEFADREAALGYLVMMGSQMNGGVDPDVLKNAFEQFKESYPQLAIMAGLNSGAEEGESTELFQHAVSMMDRVDEPNYILVYQLCNRLGGLNAKQTTPLPEKHRQEIIEKLIEWHPSLRNNQTYPWISMYIIQAVKTSGDVPTYIRLLEEEVATWRKDGSARHQVNMFGGGNQPAITLPTFPPSTLIDFPPTLVQVLGKNRARQFGITAIETSWKTSDLLEALPQVQNPILRVMLATSIEDEEPEAAKIIESTLVEGVAADTPSLDAYLMAAARAAEKREFDTAIGLLDKARYLPMQRNVRRTIDGNLLAMVLERDEMPKEDSDLMEVARGAALRLRHGTVAQQEREQLIAALEELGLTKEAERLEQKASVASSTSLQFSPVTVTPTPPDRIKELLDKDKRDVAAKIVHRELLGHIGQSISNSSNLRYTWRQAVDVADRIKGYDLVDEVLAESEPGDSTNHRKFALYALVCEALGKLEEARNSYTRAHELRPQENLYRVKLVLLNEDESPEKTAELIGKLSPAGDMLVAGEVSLRMDNYQSAVEDRLVAAKFALRYLRAREHGKNTDVSWLPGFCQGWGSQLYSNSFSVESLYVPQEKANSNDRSVSEEFLKQRRQIHDEICREMLEWPELAENAFVLLLAAHEATGEVDKQFVALAKDALLTASKQQGSVGMTGSHFSFGQSLPTNHVPMRSAEEYIARHCSENNAWAMLDEEILPALQDDPNSTLRERIESIQDLYTCPPDEFIEVAKRVFKRKPNRSVPYQSMNESELAVIEAWSYRQLDVDLRDTVFELVKQNKRTANSFNPPQFLYTFLERLSEQEDSAATVQWLEEVAQVYLGPKEERVDFITKNNTRNGVSTNSPVADVYWFQQLLSKSLEYETLVVPSLEFITAGNVLGLFSDDEYRIESAVRRLIDRKPESLVDYLASAHMLADVPELRAYPISENQSLLSEIVSSLTRHKNKSKVVRLLESRPPTLGSQLILAQLGSDSERRECLELLGQQLDSASALEGPQKRELVLMLDSAGIDKLTKDNFADSAAEAFDWYQKEKNRTKDNLTEKILATKRYEELGIGNTQLDEWLISILPDVYDRDPDLCVQLYFKITDLYQDAMQRNTVNRYYSNSVASEVLPNMARRMLPPDLNKLHMAIRIIAAERDSGFSLSHSDIQASTIPVRSAWIKHSKTNSKDPAKAIEGFHQEMHDEFGDSPESRLLIAGLSRVFEDMNDKELTAVAQSLQAQVDEEGTNRMAADMLAACQLETDSRHNHRHDSEAADESEDRFVAQAYHEHYLAQLTDDSTPLHVRSLVGMFLYNQQKDRLPASLAREIATIDTEVIRRNYEISADHQHTMCANILGLQEDSLWREIAEPFAAACKDRFLRVHRSTQQYGYPRSLHEVTASGVLTDLLSLYLKLDDEESVNQLFHRYDSRISREVESLELLILADKTQKAAGYARRFWNQLSLDDSALSDVHFEPALAEKLPEFLDKITSEDLRYFYETLFSSLRNPQPLPDDDLGDRENRLMAQAERFSQVPFNNNQLKARTLLLFRSSPAATDLVGDALRQEAADIDLRAAVQRNDSRLKDLQELSLLYVEYTLRLGDLEPAKQFVSEVCSQDSSNRYWQLESLSQQSNKVIVMATASRLDQWTQEQFEQLLSIMKTFSQDEYNFQDRNYLNSMLFLTYVGAGQADTFSAWHKQLNQTARVQLDNAGVSEEIGSWTAKLCGPPTEENQAQRLAAVTTLLQMADTCGWIERGNGLQMGLKGTQPTEEWPLDKLFTEQEILELGPQLAKAAPAEGLTWIHVARKQQAAGQHLPAAESWL